MARKFKSINDYERHLSNKWGIGDGESYKPWFTVKDVKNNKAFRKEITGLKVPRKHHLLSALEYYLFLIMDFRHDVVDIREQFPLFPLSLSRKIALTLGVEHPKVIGTKTPTPFVMTTDLLVTFRTPESFRYVAFCVKPEGELCKPSILEKVEIERVWWESIGVTFKIFIGNQQAKIQSHNILWATDIHRHGLNEHLNPFISEAAQLVPEGKSSKRGLCDTFVEQFQLDAIDAINLLRLLIGQKIIEVDLSQNQLDKSTTITVTKNINFRRELANVSGY